MVKYFFEGDTFVITDYQNAKTFASFLPAVAGEQGKPLWAFYANVGQVMAGFGANDKETPITPFDSATLAYQNIALRSFRTFLRTNGEFYAPFSEPKATQTLYIDKARVRIKETNKNFSTEITYATVPNRNYAALMRKVTITNITDGVVDVELLDGLPIFFPHGLSNFAYKELVSLMAAYCEVHNTQNKAPFVKFKTAIGDHAIVEENLTGNGYVSFDSDGKKLTPIVDLRLIFGEDHSLRNPAGFKAKSSEEFLNSEQQLENKLPAAFSYTKKKLAAGERYTFYSVYGTFTDFSHFESVYTKLTAEEVEQLFEENDRLISDILAPLYIKSGDEDFDRYLKQSFFDNNLRGGFPTLIPNGNSGEVYYIYSRKHGDMERDYNAFLIPSKYYSAGPGNFRDVNQNRRNDLYFYPFVGDYNIKLFFNLIQVDGQNPLNVSPLKFKKLKTFNKDSIAKHFKCQKLAEKVYALLAKSYEPSEMFTLLKDNSDSLYLAPDKLLALIIGQSKQEIIANFAEGYWIDHWTYNVDLLENYAAIFPDKMKDLLLDDSYRYFYSIISVEPRLEKYALLPNNEVRQYGAINLAKAKKEAELYNYDLQKTYWLKDKAGNTVHATLAAKILNLITIKFSTLDNKLIGVEMECEKPGWNDAMNGLPGLFASGVSETVELLRLVNFAIKYFPLLGNGEITLLAEQYKLLTGIEKLLKIKRDGYLDDFSYWDAASSLREDFRASLHLSANGKTKSVPVRRALRIVRAFKTVLDEAIKKAREIGDGLLPAYLYYEVTDFTKTGHVNALGYETVHAKAFKLYSLPPFLEANARALKLGPKYNKRSIISQIKKTDLYDKALGIYKTCADIDDEPFEIGRIHAFTKGWLERECNFLHMTYKYLYGLLKMGFTKEFYEEADKNFVYKMDPYIYGRSLSENSSFIVPTCNPDKSNHGRGFFARLTGANAEMMSIYLLIFFGQNLFSLSDNELTFKLQPKISRKLFDENKKIKVRLFNQVNITYYNPSLLNYDDQYRLVYKINGKTYDEIKGQLAKDIRDGKVTEIEVEYLNEK